MDYDKELHKRRTEIENALKEWSPKGGDESFIWYRRYLQSECVLLPYPGGIADQPLWWWNDVAMMEVINEYHWIPTEVKRIKDAIKSISKRKL